MGRVSNCAASSRPTRRSRRIRRAESFASNFLRNAVHLAHVSVPGRSWDCPWSRQTSNRRSQCWTRLDARSIAVPAIALIHRISTGNIPQSGSGKPEWNQYDIGLNGRCGSIVASGWWELGRCRMNATRTRSGRVISAEWLVALGVSAQRPGTRLGAACPSFGTALPFQPRNSIAPCAFLR